MGGAYSDTMRLYRLYSNSDCILVCLTLSKNKEIHTMQNASTEKKQDNSSCEEEG